MGKVKIIGAKASPFCTRPEWALKLKGVEYEYIEEDMKNKSELLLKSNPIYKKIPVLLDDGVAIAESAVILEYIDEKWKDSPLLPQDPYERAQARFWAKFADEKCLMGGAWEAFKAEGEEKKKILDSALEAFALLEKQLGEKKFFGGENIGFLDLLVGWIPTWLGVLEETGGFKILDADRFPSLHEWAQNIDQIQLLKECVPPREKLVNHFNATLSALRSMAAKKA